MPNPIFHLYQLQKLDSRLDYINDRVRSIIGIIESDARIKQAERILSDKNANHRNLEGKLKGIEDSIKEKRLKIEQSNASLYGGGIKNPKELQDLQKEIESIKSSISVLEDSELATMFEIEVSGNEVAMSENELQQITSDVFTQQSQLIAEKDTLEKDSIRLKQERAAVTGQITQDHYIQYENLRKKYKGIAVALVEECCCSSCGVTLTPAECQAAKSPTALKYCASCGRLLYAG